MYCELLAAYLASDPPNLTQAKFLVQRVPQSVRDSEEAAAQELARLWRIGRSLWTRNIAEVYKSLEGPWSQPVQRIVDKVTVSDIHTDRLMLLHAAGGLAAADQHEAGGRGVQLHQGDAARRHARGRGGGEVE